MKTVTLLLIINSFFFTSCKKETIEGQGLEFYLVDVKYDTIKGYEFNVNDDTKLGSLLIMNSEIKSYSWENHIITLNETGNSTLKALNIPFGGLPFVVTINRKPIYGGWIWNSISSVGCNWVYFREYNNTKTEKQRFEIGFGLVPDKTILGKDPRSSAEIMSYLKKTKKLI